MHDTGHGKQPLVWCPGFGAIPFVAVVSTINAFQITPAHGFGPQGTPRSARLWGIPLPGTDGAGSCACRGFACSKTSQTSKCDSAARGANPRPAPAAHCAE